MVKEVVERCWAHVERVGAEARLRDSEERLRLAVENADVGFWDVDLVNDTLIWPASTKAMFGISEKAAIAMEDFYHGLHPDDLNSTAAAFSAAADPDQRALYDAVAAAAFRRLRRHATENHLALLDIGTIFILGSGIYLWLAPAA